MMSVVNSINVREKASVQELDLNRMMEDPSHMEEEKCCGSCCWFYEEDTDGYGLCPLALMESKRCDEPCTNGKFVSKEQMRHHMAVLLQILRAWDYSVMHFVPSKGDAEEAVKFAYEYMKVFSKL